jgi:hypothetical protein
MYAWRGKLHVEVKADISENRCKYVIDSRVTPGFYYLPIDNPAFSDF